MTSPFTDYLFETESESLTASLDQGNEQFIKDQYQEPESFEPQSFESDRMSAPNNFNEQEMPTPTQDITDALNQKDWAGALKFALKDCNYTEGDLTNLLFFARHPELPKESLKPSQKNFDKLSREWMSILTKEIRPFIANEDLQVPVKFVFERDKEFAGDAGKKFKKLVQDAATDAGLDPGFLAAVLLAETFRNSYLTNDRVSSFETGTDNFFASQAQLKANVPAFKKIGFTRSGTNINEHGNEVISVLFDSGKDAALATAVYLKNGEIKLRNAAKKNGGDFDTFSTEIQFALTRIAMAAGHGGIQPNGEFVWFKRVAGKTVQAKKGEAGSFLVGVAIELDRVLNGEDILIRVNEDRADPTNSRRVTRRNATILVAQALHISACFFSSPAVSQPETEDLLSQEEDEQGESDEVVKARQSSLGKAQIFMTVQGAKQGMISGDVKEKGREGSIEVYQFHHQVQSPRDLATGQASGKRRHQPLEIVKAVDSASVKLLSSLITNEVLKDVVLNFFRTTSNGLEENFYTIKLTNATVSDMIQGNNDTAGNSLVERVQMTYQKIEWTFLPGNLMTTDSLLHSEIRQSEAPEQFYESSYGSNESAIDQLIPVLTLSESRTRLDHYLAAANVEYNIRKTHRFNAVSQFSMTDGFDFKSEDAKEKVQRSLAKLGKSCAATGRMIHLAAYGRARPSEVGIITQCLIDAGEFDNIKAKLPASATDAQVVRRMQLEFGIGIDCAGYVQLAFAFMAQGKDNLTADERERLGLKRAVGDERLESLPAAHFQKVSLDDAQTGDLIVMTPRKDDDGSMHTVIVVDHMTDRGVHKFLVDASWGRLYGDDASGIARRTLVFDSNTNLWSDIHPVRGSSVNENSTGPYNGHGIKGVFRARQLKSKPVKEFENLAAGGTLAYDSFNHAYESNASKDGSGVVPEYEYE